MKGLMVALMLLVTMFSSASAQDAEIKKMSEIDTSKGIIVLDFMATWCGPCRIQMDELKKVQERYGDKIRIISVDVDPRETEGLLANYRKEVGAEWGFAMDDNGAFNTYRNFLGGIPTLVLLKDGEMVYRHVGVTSSSDLIREIEKVL
jgi:thioredoxin 1